MRQFIGIKQTCKGILTFIPGMAQMLAGGTGGTNSARYCYSVWLRHLIMAKKSDLSTEPKIIAELGPGDSLGIGLAALLCGAERYFAFDIVEYANLEANLSVLEELIQLFEKREDIPDVDEFPNIRPPVDSNKFPEHILDRKRMANALKSDRIKSIKDALRTGKTQREYAIEIRYYVPWSDSRVVKDNSVDMVFSQAVLEHIVDLEGTYRTLHRWLKPCGFMSHEIDFKCHGYAQEWNGHWTYSDFRWWLMAGKRRWSLNRLPYSTHRQIMENIGFEILFEVKNKSDRGIPKSKLSSRFRAMDDTDFSTSDAFLLARKKGETGN
jgi:hypothetical protein